MDKLYSDNQYIDDYLLDKLPMAERAQFEARLESNSNFKLLFESRRKFAEDIKRQPTARRNDAIDGKSSRIAKNNLIIASLVMITFIAALYIMFKVL